MNRPDVIATTAFIENAIAEELLAKGSLTFDEALLRGAEKEVIEPLWDGEAAIKVERLNPVIGVTTHSGSVHADEVWACALLKYFLSSIGKKVIFGRTRNPEDWADADFVIDVGKGLLDHHGPRAEEGVSAATRVFLLLRNTFYEAKARKFWLELATVTYKVAEVDTGLSLHSPLPWLHWAVTAAEMAASQDAVEDARNKSFKEAVNRATEQIQSMWTVCSVQAAASAGAESVIDAATKRGDKVAVFPAELRWAPVKELMWEKESPIVFYVSPEGSEDWRVLCAANNEDTEFSLFSSKMLIPEKFRGLEDQDLEKATGIAGAIFAHAAGFIAGFKTREAAVEFAKLCLED